MDIVEPEKKRDFETVLPLVNIVFLLLIFFMLAGAFTKPDMFKVSVPEATITSNANRDDITILMNKSNDLAIGKTYYSESELITFIKNTLIQYASTEKELIVQLKADANVKSQDLVHILEILGTTGLRSIKILTVTSTKTNNKSP